MGLRLRKSFKLAPGIRMNLSGSGLSWTLGPRGASIGVGKRGTYLNSGIPGTGLYSRQRIGGGATSRRNQPSSFTSVSISISVTDDGTVCFSDTEGNPIPERMVAAAKRQQRDVIRSLIQEKCDEINARIEALGGMHLDTPPSEVRPKFTSHDFEFDRPIKPAERRLGWFWSMFKGRREANEATNAKALAQFEVDLREWEGEKSRFEQAEHERRELIETGIYNNVDAMERFLEATLQEIAWPRETLVSTEIAKEGQTVYIDVDLPEIDDMPTKTAGVPARGNKLTVKEMSPTNIQKLYMQHVHGIAFRTIGEVFHALPKADEVVLSGYSQRADKTTGRVSDEYLFSVRVPRLGWMKINFANLASIDVIEALTAFELRRSMTKTGQFKPIEPFAAMS